MRRIIQVAVQETERDNYPRIIALCDDGSVWITSLNVWLRMPDIPQDVNVSEPEVIEDERPRSWHENLGLYGRLDP